MDTLAWIQDWYTRHCDGEWEQEHGIGVSTLENPGWMVDINLSDTELAEVPFERLEVGRTAKDWLEIWVEDEVFYGAGGTQNLAEIFEIFREWADQHVEE